MLGSPLPDGADTIVRDDFPRDAQIVRDAVAGEEDATLAITIGKQKILPPRRARQHFIFDRNSDSLFKRRLHLLIAVDHGMQRPMLGRILHDQECRLVVGDMIMPALAGAVSDRQAVE